MQDIKYELCESPLEDEIIRYNIFDELNRILTEGTEDENCQIDAIMGRFIKTELMPHDDDGTGRNMVVLNSGDDWPAGFYRVSRVLYPLPQFVSASKVRAFDVVAKIYNKNIIKREDGYDLDEVSEIEKFRANISEKLISGIKSAARQV